MPRRTEPYEYEDMNIFIIKVTRLIAHRYELWGVTPEDVSQEAWLWVYSHEARIRGWLAKEPQQTTRVFRSLYDACQKYAEKEKAVRVGYHQDDVHWYTPSMVQTLVTFALDEEWNGMMAEHGGEAKQNHELITMVLDVRRAIDKTHTYDTFLQLNPGDQSYEDAIRSVVDALGGARHYVGRRRVITNSTAQHQDNWEDVA